MDIKKVKEMKDKTIEKACECEKVTIEYTKKNPKTALGIAAGIGALVGAAIGLVAGWRKKK